MLLVLVRLPGVREVGFTTAPANEVIPLGDTLKLIECWAAILFDELSTVLLLLAGAEFSCGLTLALSRPNSEIPLAMTSTTWFCEPLKVTIIEVK